MRSIIINTLGPAHSRKDVYFLAFDPEQVLWLDKELDQLHDCVQLIQKSQLSLTVQQDYHVIVLLNADNFENTEYRDYRERLKKVLRAWLVEQLLKPLDELSIPPRFATEIIVSSKKRDNATSPVDTFCQMFHLDAEHLYEKIELPYSVGAEKHSLDLTEMLGQNLNPEHDSEKIGRTAAKTSSDEVSPVPGTMRSRLMDEDDDFAEELQERHIESRLDSLENNMKQAFDRLQEFRLIRNANQKMPIHSLDFEAPVPDDRIIRADLQINLARLIRSTEKTGAPDHSAVKWHKPAELAQMMADAQASLEDQADPKEPQNIYFKLEENLYSESDAAGIEEQILDRLGAEANDVPSVLEALEQWKEQELDPEERSMQAKDGDLVAQVRKEMRTGMLLFIRERKRFQQRYAELQKEYDREKVLDEQKKVFDICAGAYTNWRTNERRAKPHGVRKRTEIQQPKLEKGKDKEVIAARDRCAEGVLSQLSDYSDVREEAAKLHTKFSSLARLWSPNLRTLNTRYFYRFSLVMGLIFVVLMVLPFVLISGQASDLKISRIAAYLINFGVFLVLYLIGFLYWLRRLAKQIRELRGDLEVLIIKSNQERRESVLQAIATYSRDLPICIIKQLNYSAMVETDRLNADANRKYEMHRKYMKDASDEIFDVSTALRTKAAEEGKPSSAKIDLLSPPYAPVNQNFYILFAERRENAGDHN